MVTRLINNRAGIHIQALELSDLTTVTFPFDLEANNYGVM